MTTPIKRDFRARVFVQQEDEFGEDSAQPVFDCADKTIFAWQPVWSAGEVKTNWMRAMSGQAGGRLHYEGSIEFEYDHGPLIPLLVGLLMEAETVTVNSPSPGRITTDFNSRGTLSNQSCKLGLEYDNGPYFIFHGVIITGMTLRIAARRISRITFNWKAARREQIADTMEFTHARVSIYGQLNFETETVSGPCYSGQRSGLSCSAIALGQNYLISESGENVITEGASGSALVILEGGYTTAPATGRNWSISIGGVQQTRLTEFSVVFDSMRSLTNYDENGIATAAECGVFQQSGELATFFDSDAIPKHVTDDTETTLALTGTFEGGRTLEIEFNRIRFASGTPGGPSKADGIIRAQFEVLNGAGANTLRIIV